MQESVVEPPIKSNEICSLAMVRRVAAMLDLNTNAFSNCDVLPRGWHFFMLSGETRKSSLRQDGFPGLGVPIPDLGLPRLLLGGRTVCYNGDIEIGLVVERTSFIKSITEKTTQSGRMAIVIIQHELRPVAATTSAIVEMQTYILLEAKSVSTKANAQNIESLPSFLKQKQIIPDETLLFQYSAIGFNSHKIHLDRDYARNMEGLPDLVVNGGLATLLLTEFMRIDLVLEITEIKVKHIAPLFCGRKMTLNIVTPSRDEAESIKGGAINRQLKIFDDNNNVAVEMDAK
jgi:3-methylfumaryl-CoA hydratase